MLGAVFAGFDHNIDATEIKDISVAGTQCVKNDLDCYRSYKLKIES